MPRGISTGAGTPGSSSRSAGAPALRIMGIDPGLASVGYGIIDCKANGLRYVTHGCITTDKHDDQGARLLQIFSAFSDLMEEWRPMAASMENLFFWRNVTSGIPVAEAKGVLRLAFARAGIPLTEFTPTAIKQAVSGSARAEKEQVQEMVRIILGLSAQPKPDHAADALAAAICLANHSGPLSFAQLRSSN